MGKYVQNIQKKLNQAANKGSNMSMSKNTGPKNKENTENQKNITQNCDRPNEGSGLGKKEERNQSQKINQSQKNNNNNATTQLSLLMNKTVKWVMTQEFRKYRKIDVVE